MDYVYRGVTTRQLYRFSAPVATDTTGNVTQRVTINGETAIFMNRDGSAARGTLANSSDPYSPGWNPSAWETG